MMNSTQNMVWGDINDIKRFSENTIENKNKLGKKTASIILAAIQLHENFVKGIKNLSAYDASSIILSEANWIKKNTLKNFEDKNGKKITITPGKTYYIDYGKTFCGELAYFHYGLCIGKRESKVLVVPITSGTGYINKCYHPVNNPYADKKHRQALISEGFSKDCVLKINDVKFLSAGRIEKEGVSICPDILKEIQKQVFMVEFGELFQEYSHDKSLLQKNEKQISEQKELILKLKNDNNHMRQLLINANLLQNT